MYKTKDVFLRKFSAWKGLKITSNNFWQKWNTEWDRTCKLFKQNRYPY